MLKNSSKHWVSRHDTALPKKAKSPIKGLFLYLLKIYPPNKKTPISRSFS